MNKKLILTCLLALNGVVFAAEQKNENKEKIQTEGELLLDLFRYDATKSQQDSDAHSVGLLGKLSQACPTNIEKFEGHELWEVELPAAATYEGISLLTEFKAVATSRYLPDEGIQMRIYKLPLSMSKNGICYSEIIFAYGSLEQKACSISVSSRSFIRDLETFKSPYYASTNIAAHRPGTEVEQIVIKNAKEREKLLIKVLAPKTKKTSSL